jgi:hypothetical protein
MKTYTFYSDPSHGWLKVERKEIEEIKNQISRFSYQKVTKTGDFVYLEEDCDAPKFLKLLESKGKQYKIKGSNSNNSSRIRNYCSYKNFI